MGQIDQLLRRVAGAPVRTVLLWRSRGISWKVITSNLLPEPSLSIIHHQLLPSRAGNDENNNDDDDDDFDENDWHDWHVPSLHQAGVQGRLSSFYVTFADNFPTSAQMEATWKKLNKEFD